MGAYPAFVNLRWPPDVRFTCQPSPMAKSIRARSRLWPRANSCALAMAGAPWLMRVLRAARDAGQRLFPQRKKFNGKRSRGFECRECHATCRLSGFDAMHGQAPCRSAGIGFDGRHVSVQHTKANLRLKQIEIGRAHD